MTPADRERLRALLIELSYARRPVRLASGAESTFYIDCKQTALHPEGAALLGEALLDAVRAIEARTGRVAEAAGGMTLGADPLATAVSLTAHFAGRFLPAFIVRKESKRHGTRQFIEGDRNLTAGMSVVLLEDVVTTGGSTLRAAERVREAGLVPLGVACIVDRGAGGVAALEADGLPVEALFGRADFPADDAD